MNLCLVCRDVGSATCSGLARSTCDLAQALADDGHRVRLITGEHDAPPLTLRGVSVLAVTASANVDRDSVLGLLHHSAAVYREVARLHVEDQPIDAVLAPLWLAEGALCVLDDRFPTVISCMTSLVTLSELDPLYRAMPDITERLALERATMQRARYVHGLTKAVLDKSLIDYQLEPSATAVIGRGLHDRSENRSEPRGAAGAPNGAVNVLFVGRLERRKGVDTLLEAAKLLIDEGLPLTVTVAGPSSDATLLTTFERDAAARPVMASSVRFTDAVSDRELHRLYRRADIVCAPSRYESHGVVLIEAMMFGKPIVTCDAGGIAEVVDPGRTAVVCAPDDPAALAASLRALVRNPELRALMGASGRETYERRFRASSAARQMEAFLERVIGEHGQRGVMTGAFEEGVATLVRKVFVSTATESGELARELLKGSGDALPAQAAGATGADELRAVRAELEHANARVTALEQSLAEQADTLAFLQQRHETLDRVERGGWWRLRQRLLPALRVVGWLQRRLGG